MKLILVAILGWTAAIIPLVVFAVPGVVNTPGCAHRVGITAECAAQMAAQNEHIFWLLTVPGVATVVGGYVAVTLAAVVIDRR
jgi:ABC-type microcin C transport system permease subunit YejB